MSEASSVEAKRGAAKNSSSSPINKARSLRVAKRGVRTSTDFCELMSALMSDIIEGSVTPNVGTVTANAGGKLLKMVEMEFKYGKPSNSSDKREFVISASTKQISEAQQ